MRHSRGRHFACVLIVQCLPGALALALAPSFHRSRIGRGGSRRGHLPSPSPLPLRAVPPEGNGENDGGDAAATELDELSQPSVSFSRNSLLFGVDPPSQADNAPLRVWRTTKDFLPRVVTGAWEEGAGDRSPAEHLYNMAFVRLPMVFLGLIYVKNLAGGHPLIMELWNGPFEVSPLIVLVVLAVVLR